MSLNNANNKVVYTGDGATSVFAYSFKIFANTDLKVTKVKISDSSETALVLTTDYTVSGVGLDAGGSVTLTAGALPTTDKLVIQRSMPLTQLVDYLTSDKFPAETHEQALDRLTMIDQQQQEAIDRSVKVPKTESTAPEFPKVDAAANTKFLTNDGSKMSWAPMSVTTTQYNGTLTRGSDSAKPASPAVGDLYFATDTRKTYFCYSAGTWTELKVPALAIRVSQTSHGFVLKDVLRHNGTQYVKAQADSEANSQAIGIVSEVIDANTFVLTLKGEVTGLSGLTAGSLHYLSPTVAGALTTTKPTTVGQVVKPILLAISTTAGFAVNQFGDLIVANPGLAGIKVGSFTRDMTLASGTQAVTGVGFTPRALFVVAGRTNTAGEMSVGFSEGAASSSGLRDQNYVVAGSYSFNTGTLVDIIQDASAANRYSAVIASFDSDGFTLTWTRTGVPTGTLTAAYLALR